MFEKLTRAQKAVMEVLCTMTQSTMKAYDIKPATLGCLASKGMVNVVDGLVHATCAFAWNMVHHPELYVVDDECRANIQGLINFGRRISAIKTLRAHTGMNLRDSVSWVDYHYPK